MKLHLALALAFMVALSAALPSDHIRIGQKPALMALSGATPASARTIDALNEPLGMFNQTDHLWPNIGHYALGVKIDNSTEIPLTWSQANFVGATDTGELLSVGNASGKNVTVINSTSTGLVYL